MGQKARREKKSIVTYYFFGNGKKNTVGTNDGRKMAEYFGKIMKINRGKTTAHTNAFGEKLLAGKDFIPLSPTSF